MNTAHHQSRWRIFFLASQMARHRPKLSLTQKGIAFCALTLGVGFVALNSGNNLIYLVLGMMLSLILSSGVLSSINLHKVRVKRHQELKGYAGERICVELTLSNRKARWPSMGIGLEDPPIYDQRKTVQGLFKASVAQTQIRMSNSQASQSANQQANQQASQQAMYIFRLKAQESESVHYYLRIERRGEYLLEGARIYTRFPFGFFEKSIGLRLQQKLYISPRSDVPLSLGLEQELNQRSTALKLNRNRHELPSTPQSISSAHHHYNHAYSNEYSASLDPYQTGMPLKWIHWKSSAKRGELLIRKVLPEKQGICPLWINPFYHQMEAPSELEHDGYADFIMTVCERLWQSGYTLKIYGFNQIDLSWERSVIIAQDSEASQVLMRDLVTYKTKAFQNQFKPPIEPCLKLSISQGLSLIEASSRLQVFEPLKHSHKQHQKKVNQETDT